MYYKYLLQKHISHWKWNFIHIYFNKSIPQHNFFTLFNVNFA